MTAGWIVFTALVVSLVILPAILGFAFDRLRRNRSRLPLALTADTARAQATLTYYNEVHDSHTG
jgi:hypothetical protein